jgi:endonuclease V-like protein UPF0215 family
MRRLAGVTFYGSAPSGVAMKREFYPHVLGVDDGPFRKGVSDSTPIVGVMMEGARLVEAVAMTEFPIDGDDATGFLSEWIRGLRFHQALQAVVFGGVTIAGLGVIDIVDLALRVQRPVLAVNRRDPTYHRLQAAFDAAGLSQRLETVKRTPAAFRMSGGLFVAAAGVGADEAGRLLQATMDKSELPQPLRVAHLVARAMVRGESRGRP